jgi:prevent-host-death family protein
MSTVGVRDLKAHLSRHLKRVQAGTRLIVTDRGRAVATIVPVEPAPALDWLHAMVARGDARWEGGKPRGLTPRLASRGKPASRMVLDDRR